MGETNNEDNLEMDMFDSNIELNFDYVPEEEIVDHTVPQTADNVAETETSDNTEEPTGEGEIPDDMPDVLREQEITPSEGDPSGDPETVAGDEASDVEGDDQSSPNLYSSIATVLHEQGLLPSLDAEKKIETIDDFVASFKEEVENQKFDGLNDLQKEALEAFENGISVEQFRDQKESEMSLDGITDDVIKADVQLAKEIVKQDLINQGVDETTASKLVERTAIASEEQLVDDAIESIENVKKFQKDAFEAEQTRIATQKIEAAKAVEVQNAKFKDEIYNKKEIVKGQEINEAIKDSVYKTMSTIVGRGPDGQPENKFMQDRRENPVEFDTNLYYLYELTKGFKDFSNITTPSKSTAVRELENIIRKNPFIVDENQPAFTQDADSYDAGPLGDELNI